MELLPEYGDTYPLPKKTIPIGVLIIVDPLTKKAFAHKFIPNNVDVPLIVVMLSWEILFFYVRSGVFIILDFWKKIQ